MVGWRPLICGVSAGPEAEPSDDAGVRGPGVVDQEGDGVGTLLVGGAQERHEPALGLGSPVGAVAAPHLAVDDGGPDALLASPVGGVDAVDGEEAQEGGPLVAEMLDQAAV